MQTAEAQQRRLMRSVAQAVVQLDASGDRTIDAIENWRITLSLTTMQDDSRLAELCNSGGKTLKTFGQALARELQLSGKVSEMACTGAGRDDDPFVLKFRLHYESGGR